MRDRLDAPRLRCAPQTSWPTLSRRPKGAYCTSVTRMREGVAWCSKVHSPDQPGGNPAPDEALHLTTSDVPLLALGDVDLQDQVAKAAQLLRDAAAAREDVQKKLALAIAARALASAGPS